MESGLEAVRAYFRARNEAWVSGNLQGAQEAASVRADESWWHVVAQGMKAKRNEMIHRQSRLLRAHTYVTVQSDTPSADGAGRNYVLDERVTWVYRDGIDLGVEARVIRHWQHWRFARGRWYLQQLAESDERPSHNRSFVPVQPRSDWVLPTGVWADAVKRPGHGYDRIRAQRYAELWWDRRHPAFAELQLDGTNFVSQCLLAGNFAMMPEGAASGWWYRFRGRNQAEAWSPAWMVAHSLYMHLVHDRGAELYPNARNLKVADVVFYDWDGEGQFEHAALVVDFDAKGDPLVNAHSDPSCHRHYLYMDSRAWSAQTRYAFVHIPDDTTQSGP
ncbi:MAG: amidase domain-containing protein [Alicyclobacillaceae bacterium]|nr:amidase domain-containing protein [Alicyclobacillaceae bacterium]